MLSITNLFYLSDSVRAMHDGIHRRISDHWLHFNVIGYAACIPKKFLASTFWSPKSMCNVVSLPIMPHKCCSNQSAWAETQHVRCSNDNIKLSAVFWGWRRLLLRFGWFEKCFFLGSNVFSLAVPGVATGKESATMQHYKSVIQLL